MSDQAYITMICKAFMHLPPDTIKKILNYINEK